MQSAVLLFALWLPTGGGAQTDTAAGRRVAPPEEPGGPQLELPLLPRVADRVGDKDEAGLLAPGADPDNHLLVPLLKHMIIDQQRFWASPAELGRRDAWKEFAPFVGFAGLLLAEDSAIARQVPGSPGAWKRSKDISDYAAFSLVGAAAGAYLWGHRAHDDHLAETGFLSAEAALNSTLAAYTLKEIARRSRPFEGSGNGPFFRGGSSFPSEHAALAWSVASVLAHEYPGPLVKIAAYGLASGVTLTRVTAREHFSSDVVVGSALGWYFARKIYRARHDAELGGAAWGNLVDPATAASNVAETEGTRSPARMASPDVPLDSWIYAALERLAAFGYLGSSFAGLKPWSRLECAQMIEDAGETLDREEGASPEARQLESRLRAEFLPEFGLLDGGRNFAINLESIYVREVSASGPVLNDGYHFGQTLAYDYGRPFRRGNNDQAGASVSVTAGPIAVYLRAEFQHSPESPPLSAAARNFIAAADLVPVPPAASFAAIDRPRLLDAYVALKAGRNWQFSFGQESLSWGPGLGGSFLLSNNAEPIPMARLVTTDLRLPGVLRWLGPARIDNFFGQLAGHNFIPHPYIYGNKINFKPFRSLELGFGRTVIIGGRGGDPLTAENFLLSFFGRVRASYNSVPGASHSSFDWTFYVPKLRNYLVFYGDLYASDDPVPFFNPPKNPYRPGIYLTRLPRLPQLDFHLEAADTESPWFDSHGDLNYWNHQYRDGYTNGGNLLGNTTGRMGRTIQAWFTYWISPANSIQFTYKHSSASPEFVPGGGDWQDYGLHGEWHLRSGFYLKSAAQYEHIASYPLLFRGPQQNVIAIAELGFAPARRK